jgi:hypothetical protein
MQPMLAAPARIAFGRNLMRYGPDHARPRLARTPVGACGKRHKFTFS